MNDENIYTETVIEEDIVFPFNYLNKNIENHFMDYSKKYIEGKCRKEGYIRQNSVSILNISNGLLKENDICYKVYFKVQACIPYKNMILNAKIKNITKIGIRAVVNDIDNPIVLFVSSEHNPDKNMNNYNIGQIIELKIIDFRFELYDEFISAIAEII